MKKLLIALLILTNVNLYSYELLDSTLIINNTNENIDIHYQACSDTGPNAICKPINKIKVTSNEYSDNIGRLPMELFYKYIFITKIISPSRISHFASMLDELEYGNHGYNDSLIKCNIWPQTSHTHLFIEIIDNQIACIPKDMFNGQF